MGFLLNWQTILQVTQPPIAATATGKAKGKSSLPSQPKTISSQSRSSARASKSKSASWASPQDFEEIVPDSEEERNSGYAQDTIYDKESDKIEDAEENQKISERSPDESYIDDHDICLLIDLLGTNDNLDFSEAILQEMDLHLQENISENKVSDHGCDSQSSVSCQNVSILMEKHYRWRIFKDGGKP